MYRCGRRDLHSFRCAQLASSGFRIIPAGALSEFGASAVRSRECRCSGRGTPGESSSKETKVDLSPPADDDKEAHPQSSDLLVDESRGAAANADVSEFHPWNPHKAAKDVEVGDFYFKRKNYRAAGDRYREALYYKDNDADATFRLAVCLEKMDQPDEARQEYESYLKILPQGPQSGDAQKAIDRLKATAASAKPTK